MQIRVWTEKRHMGWPPPRRRVDEAIELQKSLRSLGFDLGRSGPRGDGVDGKIGPNTRAALEEYRLDRRLTPAETLDRLEAEYSALVEVELPLDPRGEAPADARAVIASFEPLNDNCGPEGAGWGGVP
jgi:hypothetical protein